MGPARKTRCKGPPGHRISACFWVDQNTERQLETVKLDKVFTDKASGRDTKRPQLSAALEYVREGDTLLVHSLDRLARKRPASWLCRLTQGSRRRIWRARMESVERRCISTFDKTN
jgi:DNA invertase Pin-like site-specific DNA recombinase